MAHWDRSIVKPTNPHAHKHRHEIICTHADKMNICTHTYEWGRYRGYHDMEAVTMTSVHLQ